MNKWMDIPTLAILSLKRRSDRRNVAISSALWGNFNISHTRFVDAIDAKDYESVDDLLHAAIEDGFPEFESLWGYPDRSEMNGEEERMGFTPVAYAWSLCRYFRELSKKTDYEFFIHDDMYGRHFKYFHVDRWLVTHIQNSCILKHFCNVKDVNFVCFLLNTESVGFKTIQPFVFDEVVIGTNRLNMKAGIFSPYGADVILKRLRHQISIGNRTPKSLLNALESTDGWDVEGVFSTTEPLFVEFPDDFLGSDIRGIEPLKGEHLKNIFSDVKPS